ncbi:hypothetical protein HBO23_30480 [Pseudomonas sp. WS 5532]|jgi:hypothetical protein|uniref:Uncharacterized protein n=2 Tax=Pseudomonas TaxID=286 RepID=A0ABT5N8N7_9PSED|nr:MULTISPECIES: hypothetical protein [Pseudomonas]ETK39568.1 hypothetical protein H098_21980 [Pseudomonas fluorescens FH5]KRP76128.1 hypothetical protein TU80_17975 [Pseudomonas veronii]OEC73003.1 hypothetical protein A7D21_27910 [Pseudomonas sp. AP19]ONH38927.1 hypothetical protein BLL38_22100 [Pseudomonas gessardii]OOL38228.1 hypothetical protein BOO94_08650 [Pseudomonas sp. FSL W5-0299]PHN40244.1 hypothetical protein AO259_26555 [Pseudomonas sp. ICMP 564]
MVTDLELDDLGSPRTFEMSGKLCEEPTHGRASTLQAKDDSAVFIARWVVWSSEWWSDDGKLIQHQKTPCQTLLAIRSSKHNDWARSAGMVNGVI